MRVQVVELLLRWIWGMHRRKGMDKVKVIILFTSLTRTNSTNPSISIRIRTSTNPNIRIRNLTNLSLLTLTPLHPNKLSAAVYPSPLSHRPGNSTSSSSKLAARICFISLML